ncbi:GTP cyclohydrolase II [Candidatus Gracilibacteria bacterium]|nr:GTP cyclohydrolase II [Candidatus Gracilibacteria bacterium]
MVGLISALYALMQFIAAPTIGSLSDRFGRRPVLLLCLAGTACAYIVLGLADSLLLIALAVALDGITGGTNATAQAYIADVTTPEQRARGLGIVGAAFGLGLMLGPALGGLLSGYGLWLPAFGAATVAVINIGFGLLVLPESLPLEHRSRGPLNVNPFIQFVALQSGRYLRGMLLAIFLLNLAFAGLQSNFPLFSMEQFDWDARDNGLFFAFVGVCAVVTQGLLLGVLQPRIGERRLALFGLALMALALLLVALVPQAWLLYPLVGLIALGSGLAIPALTALVSGQVGEQRQGALMGGLQSLLSVTLIVGPVLAGLIFDGLGPPVPYLLGGLLVALAWISAAIATGEGWRRDDAVAAAREAGGVSYSVGGVLYSAADVRFRVCARCSSPRSGVCRKQTYASTHERSNARVSCFSCPSWQTGRPGCVPFTTIRAEYPERTAMTMILPHVKSVATTTLPTRYGNFTMHIYNDEADKEQVALTVGAPSSAVPLVRLHSECLTGDVFHSQRCDCGEQLEMSLARLHEEGCGVLLYLRQEGRGIGLTNKIRAYALQDQGLDTLDANHALGLPADAREYGVAAAMLHDLGVTAVRLLTNNPEKIEALEAYGIRIAERVAVQVAPNRFNRLYLRTKHERMGHL